MKEREQRHHWQLSRDPDCWATLYVTGALTDSRIALLRKYIDLALSEADEIHEGPDERPVKP